MVALSLSTLTSGSSTSTVSPGPTRISTTSTSSKSPISGTRIRISLANNSPTLDPESRNSRIGLGTVQPIAADRFGHLARPNFAGLRQSFQAGNHHRAPIDLEELAQF